MPAPPNDLRDWFAGQALTGLLAQSAIKTGEGTGTIRTETMAAKTAALAYVLADAMIKARDGGEK
jgi:hypothetical protein